MSAWVGWGVLLGVAVGGFFDGILLHQILQWHHLLSLVDGMADLRTQVLWDGYFHALMYALAAAALIGLWRAHAKDVAGPGRALAGALLVGFALWHVLDTVLSHWLLGIHRIRVDTDNPLFWDLVWLGVFGAVPLAAGLPLLRGSGRRRPATAASLALLAAGTLAAGLWASRAPAGEPFATVVFAPGTGSDQVVRALAASDARLVWSDPDMGVVGIAAPPHRRWALYRNGAILVTGAGLPAGCFGWSRTRT